MEEHRAPTTERSISSYGSRSKGRGEFADCGGTTALRSATNPGRGPDDATIGHSALSDNMRKAKSNHVPRQKKAGAFPGIESIAYEGPKSTNPQSLLFCASDQ